MVDWDQWRTLLATFRHGTYAGAAKSLRVDATTVGRRLSLLEKHLGYDLFMREKERLFPTRRCEALLTHIEAAAEALRGAEQQSASVERGAVWRDLRMTAPPFLMTNLFAPAIAALTYTHRIRVELIGTASKVGLARREADIAIRIEDRSWHLGLDSERIEADQVGMLGYAVYCGHGLDPESLPWAGLIEQHGRNSGSDVMMTLAGREGFQYQAYHFETLREVTATGVARAMLPRIIGDRDPRLTDVSDTVLEQPLWMLYHRQDCDVVHLKAARSWVGKLAREM